MCASRVGVHKNLGRNKKMNTKIAATLTILIFALSTVAIAVPPASAHFTVGQLTGVSRWRTQDFDPHVPGVVGYVFPGGGSAAWGGAPSSAFPAPGYQSPYPGGNPAGAPSSSWYQLEGNAYAPFGAILTSTDDHANKGDLIFAMNFTPPAGFAGNVYFRRWYIYIPPEFGTVVRTQVTTTVTDDYNFIRVSKAAWNDPFGPGWTVVQIRGEDGWGTAVSSTSINSPNPTVDRGVGRGPRRGIMAFTAARGYAEWFYVRVNGVTAPTIAGRYFFKYIMRACTDSGGGLCSGRNYLSYPPSFYDAAGAPAGLGIPVGADPGSLAVDREVPVQNWPVLLVKGEIDPAIIDGVLRYAGTNTTLYGTPLNLAGRVRAVGIATDPYTGQSTKRNVEARGYFNATAHGHFEIEGVAPGVYTIYAEAAGFPEQVIAENVQILAGQSFHFDGLLNPGVVIHGQVFSKHNFGEEAWTRVAPIRIELWDSNDYTNPSHMVASSPWDRFGIANPITGNGGYGTGTNAPIQYGDGRFDVAGLSDGSRMSYGWSQDEASNPQTGNGAFPQRVAFDWEFGPAYYNNVNANNNGPAACGTVQVNFDGTTSDVCRRHDGVGPAQFWWVDPAGMFTNGGGSGSFIYQFGYKIGGAAIYGAPKDLDGHVPQALVTYINGITPGRYYVRAYVNGYVQTTLDGRTFQDYFFDVAKDAWSGDVSVPLDLLKSSFITKTIHFHDIPGSLIENGVPTTRWVFVEVWDVSSDLSAPVLRGWNMTVVEAGVGAATLDITGFGLHGFTPTAPIFGPDGTSIGSAGSHRVSTFGWQGPPYEDYGLPAGTYELRTYVKGYVQQTFERVTIALSNSPASVSDHMWKGAHFNVTVFSTDWERPRVERPWIFPGEEIYVWFTDSKGNVVDFDGFINQGLVATGTPPHYIYDPTATQANDIQCTDNWYGPAFPGPPPGGAGVCTNYFEGNDVWEYPILGDVFNRAFSQVVANGGGGEPVLPTSFDTDTYSVTAYTYGYVQKKPFTLFAQKGNSTADIKVNLVQGANITLNLKFKLENIFTPTFANMSMRMRLFNEKGQLVAAWQTSPLDEFGGGVRSVSNNFNPSQLCTFYPDIAGAFVAGQSIAGTGLNCYASAYARGSPDFRNLVLNYVPAGTTDLQVNLAGIMDAYYDPAKKGFSAGYNGPDGSPATLDGSDYPYGIDGYPNYQGSWTIEADSVWWYNAGLNNFYPPVQGLLQGESFHTIPGHANGLYGYVGDVLSANHLGPYAQRSVWTVPNAHLGGESSVTFELDQRAYLAGRIDAFTWSGELRPLSFAGITIAGADGFKNTAYTWDGQYETFLNPGDYNFTIWMWSPTGQGLKTLTAPVHLSDGQTAVGQNFGPLERSNIPIPEFSGLAVVAFSALAASLYLLRRRRR